MYPERMITQPVTLQVMILIIGGGNKGGDSGGISRWNCAGNRNAFTVEDRG